MRLFDVLGPVMIGPSSSHTAGAARIGYTAQKLLGDVPVEADIGLYGSFATTGRGHGTDRALVAGLLGLRPDDPRLPDSFALAEEAGMKFTIHPVELRAAHPNTAVLTLKSKAGRTLVLKAASVGGGRIRVTEIDGVPADFGGDSNTLIIHNEDTPGCIAEVTMSLAQRRINIASMQRKFIIIKLKFKTFLWYQSNHFNRIIANFLVRFFRFLALLFIFEKSH